MLKDKSKWIFFSGCILIYGSLVLTVELINDFQKSKSLYASIFQKESFIKDCLNYYEHTPVGDGGCNDCPYYFTGILKKNKIKATIIANDIFENLECKNLPVWYCTYSRTVYFRTSNEIPSPFCFDWFGVLMLIVLFPNLIFFLYLKFKR
jgi:hypothetical protein